MAQGKQITQKKPAKAKPAALKKVVAKKVASASTAPAAKRVAIKKSTTDSNVAVYAAGKKGGGKAVKSTRLSGFRRPASISEEQWQLPAGLKTDGTFATLGEVLSQKKAVYSLESLSSSDKKVLVIERIKLQPHYPTKYMLGVGEVNKDRAIAEVRSGTAAGQFILESEQNVIQLMKMQAKL